MFGESGKKQVSLAGTSFTKKALLVALRKGGKGLKRAVIAKLKEVSG